VVVDSAFEGDGEGVEGWLPAGAPSLLPSTRKVEASDGEIQALIAACSVGKWPRARTLRRSRACTLSEDARFRPRLPPTPSSPSSSANTNAAHASQAVPITCSRPATARRFSTTTSPSGCSERAGTGPGGGCALFEGARHGADVRFELAKSDFADLLTRTFDPRLLAGEHVRLTRAWHHGGVPMPRYDAAAVVHAAT